MAIIAIPVRMESTRLPGKAMLARTGKPLFQHVYDEAKKCNLAAAVAIVTDSAEVASAARAFGDLVVYDPSPAKTGSDRISHAIDKLPDAALIVNWQSDEPEVRASDVDELLRQLAGSLNPWASCGTLACDQDGGVRVAVSSRGKAVYFSRHPIGGLRHIGVYAFTKDLIRAYGGYEQTPAEVGESLEQLRIISRGMARIRVLQVEPIGLSINTPEEYDEFVDRFRG